MTSSKHMAQNSVGTYFNFLFSGILLHSGMNDDIKRGILSTVPVGN
jgi:hypothetical protein